MKRTALLLVPALAIALGACSGVAQSPGQTTGSGESVGDSGSTAATGSTGSTAGTGSTAASSTVASSSATTSVVATGSTATPTALPTTFTTVNKTIKDPELGHEIVVTRIARNLPWPAGYKASAEAYELVAVEMKWTPGTTYTAAIRLQDFAINTGSQFPNRPDTLVNTALEAATWALLPAEVPNGKSVTGWVVFKVDPRKAPKMIVDYTRPESQLDNGTTFPRTTFSATIVG